MPFLPVPNTAAVEMIYSVDGQIVENVFHCYSAVGYAPVDLTGLAVQFKGWYSDNLRGSHTSAVSLVKIKVSDLSAENAPVVEYASGLPIYGDWVGDTAPLNVAVVVKWTTGLRGRSYRGRTYHFGMSMDGISTNYITSTFRTALAVAYGNLLSRLNAASTPLVVVSRRNNNQPRLFGVTTPVTDYSVDTTLDSQRRRLPGRGR